VRRGRAAALVVSLAGGAALLRSMSGAATSVPTAIARVEPFDLTLVETGTLQALRSVTYSSTIQSNQAKSVALAPEGRVVEKGDLLILFDGTPFEEQIREAEAALALARAEEVRARQDLAQQEVANAGDLASARQKEERSALELKDSEEGEGRLKEEETRAELAEAERVLRRVSAARDDLRPLLSQGFITRQEMERAELEVEKAQESVALARRRHDAFFRFGRPIERSQAASDAVAARESARAAEKVAASRLEQRRAALDGALGRVREARSRLETARAQLARCEVRAEVPGIVVYRTVFFGSEQRKPQVGDQVWANQPLIILPDVSKMTVETRVRETDVHRVVKNQNAVVRVAAYPDLRLAGRVTLVGALAQDDAARRGAKYFGITIEIDGVEPRLRPGMTATVEIAVEKIPQALVVPIQAVFENDGRRVVHVRGLTGFEERDVRIGPVNRDVAVVTDGLRAGERVALVDPRGESESGR
jgi:HlyD family secretion protein